MPPKNKNTADTSDREIVITRVFDAPRELVFNAWTDPQHLPHWWGPRGFTITTQSIEVRAGGTWRFTMHGPDGTNYPNLITYQEIVHPERLVYVHGSDDRKNDPHYFVTTITFEADGAKTKVTMRGVFNSAEALAFVVKNHHAIEGGKQTMERLGEHLASITGSTLTADREVISTRVVNSPPERVWNAFADPKELARWWGPKDFTNTFREFDLRPDGMWRFTMHAPNGANFNNESRFVEVTPPSRVVFRHLGPVHAFDMTITLTAKSDQTEVIWKMVFDSTAECAKTKKFVSEGNEQNFDRLEAHLKSSP